MYVGDITNIIIQHEVLMSRMNSPEDANNPNSQVEALINIDTVVKHGTHFSFSASAKTTKFDI
jgi:hypothetical protein